MLARQINLPNDSGTVTLHEEDRKYHIHRYAARGKINNTIANYEFIDDNNVSSLIPCLDAFLEIYLATRLRYLSSS